MSKHNKPEHLPRGISMVSGLYRAAIGIEGEMLQEYFPTLDEAIKQRQRWEKLRKTIRKRVNGADLRQRHSNKKASDLPTGIYEVRRNRLLKSGNRTVVRYIITSIWHQGRMVKHFSAVFGARRTRQEAIDIVIRRAARYRREHGLL